MKNYIETEMFAIKPKEFTHKKGTGSSCSFMMKGNATGEGDEPLVWWRAVSFDMVFKPNTSYLVKGSIQVTAPYGDRPAGLQVVVKKAVELNEGRYAVAIKRHSVSKDYVDPVAELNPASTNIPM